MGDVADILGVPGEKIKDSEATSFPTNAINDGTISGDGIHKAFIGMKVRKPAGMSREVYSLLGQQGLPTLAPSKTGKISFKEKRKSGAINWLKKEFLNNARNDDLKLRHWVKASVDLPVYPFARFNASVDVVEYTDEDYRNLVEEKDKNEGTNWTKEETDYLLSLCHKFDLRWIIIADRYNFKSKRSIEELKDRYYSLVSILTSQSCSFNLEYEKKRKQQLNCLFERSKDDEEEIGKLNSELKQLELQLKKVSTKGDPLVKKQLKELTPKTEALVFSNTKKPGISLRSWRQSLPHRTQAFSQRFIQKMNLVLEELKIPRRPLPTLTVCDMYDKLRQDIVQMLSLKKLLKKKELIIATYQSNNEKAEFSDSLDNVGLDSTQVDLDLSTNTSLSQRHIGKVVRAPTKRKGSATGNIGKRMKKI